MFQRQKSQMMHAVSLALALSVAFRSIIAPCAPWLTSTLLFILLSSHVLLLAAEPWCKQHLPRFSWYYFPLQMLLITIIHMGVGKEYVGILFIPLCIQAMSEPQQRQGLRWVVVLNLHMAAIMLRQYSGIESFAAILTYAAACFFVGSYSYILAQEEHSSKQAQQFLQELGEAHRQLTSYAEKVEALAIAQERNRLARELHDSVTQTLFSINLLTQSSLILADRDPAQLKAKLQQLQELAQGALKEMRGLLSQLRLSETEEHEAVAFLPALREHINAVQQQHDLNITFDVTGDSPDLPPQDSYKLLRIAQEALHNIVKHAKSKEAHIALHTEAQAVQLVIEDQGVGFSTQQEQHAGGGMGLSSMQERAQMMGAQFQLDSRPGQGTRIQIALPLSLS